MRKMVEAHLTDTDCVYPGAKMLAKLCFSPTSFLS
jgi:hypothetical protein